MCPILCSARKYRDSTFPCAFLGKGTDSTLPHSPFPRAASPHHRQFPLPASSFQLFCRPRRQNPKMWEICQGPALKSKVTTPDL
jgi:hypothetical protein